MRPPLHSALGRALVFGSLSFARLVGAQSPVASGASAPAPTVTHDIAPIFQQKCQVCHRDGAIAPMSLVTYAEVQKYGKRIRSRVAARRMPPWHLDKTVGIQSFKNDRSLSDEQIATIVNWIDAGMPEGDPKDLPAPPTWPDPKVWQLADKFGPPDLIVKSDPYTIAPRGQDKWWRPLTPTGVTEPRWVRAIEVKPSFPGGRKVVHHVLATLVQDEKGVTGLASSAHHASADGPMSAGLFMEWALGKVGEVFPSDAGKLMLPGSKIRWEIHYYAVGQQVPDDQVELGVWFYPKGVVPKHRTILNFFDVANDAELDIAPNQKSVVQNYYVLPAPARLENFQPHMHMRGKAMMMEAVYPDGHREVLSHVNNFQWNWHVNYIYADSVAPVLPKGTTLVFTAWHDNTRSNPNNPDPDQWVGWGDRTVDEMAHAWVDVTYLEEEEYAQIVAERKKRSQHANAGVP
ncbi:MAG: cytochrome c [Gemmatimonadaceae bacterium]